MTLVTPSCSVGLSVSPPRAFPGAVWCLDISVAPHQDPEPAGSGGAFIRCTNLSKEALGKDICTQPQPPQLPSARAAVNWQSRGGIRGTRRMRRSDLQRKELSCRFPSTGETLLSSQLLKQASGEKKNKKKLAGLTWHQFTAYCYIFKAYKTIDHKQGNYFCPYLKASSRR